MSNAEVTPSELKFRFQLNKQLPASISIHNPTSERIGFKVKTTTPKKYMVRPSTGQVDPHSTSNVQVIMQTQREYPADFANCKDKFLVQTVVLLPGEDANGEIFKSASAARDRDIREAKLKVILEGPPAPPSPVPEASELEEEVPRGGGVSIPASGGAGDDSRLKSTLDDLAHLTQENKSLKAQIAVLVTERDELKRRADANVYANKAAPVASAGQQSVAQNPLAGKLALLNMVVIALIAFLIGHYS